jgi:hypothetical protein
MKREELKKLLGEAGTDEVIDKIMAINGSDIEAHKKEASTSGEKLTAIQEQLKEANKQIEGFKGMKPEDVDAKIGEWETKYKDLETKHATEAKQRAFDTALEKGLTASKVKDVVAVKAHLKLDGLKLNEDGSFVGLKEQLEPLQKDKSYLFEADENQEETPEIVAPTNTNSTKTSTFEAAMLKGAGLKAWPEQEK